MCVIIACEDNKPALSTLESAESLNNDGGGIAWIEKGLVKYQKGLTAKQIHRITKKISLPFIIHFRIRSVGKINKRLCHPFPLTTDQQKIEQTKGLAQAVLFHNGTWSQWDDVATEITHNLKLDKWSDSKMMAYLAKKYGRHVLSFISKDNKIAILTSKGIEYYGDAWKNVKKLKCSNDYFENTRYDFGSWQGENYNMWRLSNYGCKRFTNTKKAVKSSKTPVIPLVDDMGKYRREQTKRDLLNTDHTEDEIADIDTKMKARGYPEDYTYEEYIDSNIWRDYFNA